MLGDATLEAMVGTSRPEAARAFYEGILGLTFVSEDPFALIFEAANAPLRIAKMAEVSPPSGTALGWRVADLPAAVRTLIARGVMFERFEGMGQDDLGLWIPGGGPDGVAWFKDPDGNLLSLSGPAGG